MELDGGERADRGKGETGLKFSIEKAWTKTIRGAKKGPRRALMQRQGASTRTGRSIRWGIRIIGRKTARTSNTSKVTASPGSKATGIAEEADRANNMPQSPEIRSTCQKSF